MIFLILGIKIETIRTTAQPDKLIRSNIEFILQMEWLLLNRPDSMKISSNQLKTTLW